MKKSFVAVLVCVVIMASLCLHVYASEPYTFTVPDYFVRQSEGMYYTDSCMINDKPAEIWIMVSVTNSTQTENVFNEETLSAMKSQYAATEGFYNHVDAPQVMCTASGLRYIQCVYQYYFEGTLFTTSINRFYSSTQCCEFRYLTATGIYFAFDPVETMLDTLVFDDTFDAFKSAPEPEDPEPETMPTVPTETQPKQPAKTSGKSGDFLNLTLCILLGIGITGFVFLIAFVIIREIYLSKFDYGKWDQDARPDPAAEPIDLKSESIHLGKNNQRYRTTVTFSDGYRFITHKTKREDKAFSYIISMDGELRREILQTAIQFHAKAVEKKGVALPPVAVPMPVAAQTQDNNSIAQASVTDTEMLNDATYIKALEHNSNGPWHQYDVLMNTRGYGWDFMCQWAEYMNKADLDVIQEVQIGGLAGMEMVDITASFNANGGIADRICEFRREQGVLSIAGFSRVLNMPMKIVWFNQTSMIRLFTVLDDQELIRKYAETVIRRSFGTEESMKLGQPISE